MTNNIAFEEFAIAYDLNFHHVVNESYLWFFGNEKIFCDFSSHLYVVHQEKGVKAFSTFDSLMDYLDFQY